MSLEEYGTMKIYQVSKRKKDKGFVIAAHLQSAINKAKKQFPNCDTIAQTTWKISMPGKEKQTKFKMGPY